MLVETSEGQNLIFIHIKKSLQASSVFWMQVIGGAHWAVAPIEPLHQGDCHERLLFGYT